LGTGSNTNLKEWTLITTPGFADHAIKDTTNSGHCDSKGTSSAYAVSDEGRLFVTGYNVNGQLGLWLRTNVNAWTEVALEGVAYAAKDVAVPKSAQFASAYLVTKAGNLLVAGKNNVGQLGLGATANTTTWTKVSAEGLLGQIKKWLPAPPSQVPPPQIAYAVTKAGNLFVAGTIVATGNPFGFDHLFLQSICTSIFSIDYLPFSVSWLYLFCII
jgi:hypothetical protein